MTFRGPRSCRATRRNDANGSLSTGRGGSRRLCATIGANPSRRQWAQKLSLKSSIPDFLQVSTNICRGRTFLSRCLSLSSNLPIKDVLEIGTGLGTHAQLLSPSCKSFTGIDLTETASALTAQRLRLFGLPGRALRMDAEDMQFASNSFDYIWSWGVIHHSADTRRILAEMKRVLRSGGKATVMVYHRAWWSYYLSAVLRGVVRGQLKRYRNLHEVAQAATDGAIARYYTPHEWGEVSKGLFDIEAIRIYGLKAEILPFPAGRSKTLFERFIPDAFGRLVTNHLRLGSFLVADMRRASS